MAKIDDEHQRLCLEQLADLLEMRTNLTQWEKNFCDALNNWHGNFSEKQAQTLADIALKRL